jgi:nucleotide-binding universal stress UspA family protein
VVQRLVEGTTAKVLLFIVGEPPAATLEDHRTVHGPVAVTSSLPGAAPSAVLPAQTPGYAENRDQAVQRRENELIDQLRDAAHGLSSLRTDVEIRVAFGDAAHEIVRTAAKDDVDLLCMATHGRTGLQGVLHGSVTEAVLRSGVAPVLVVPTGRGAN